MKYKTSDQMMYDNEIHHSTSLGTNTERNDKFKRLNMRDRNSQLIENKYDIQVYTLIRYFDLTKPQKDSIKFRYAKITKKRVQNRIGLIATLIYREGISIIEIKKIFRSLGHRMTFRLILNCFIKHEMKRYVKKSIDYLEDYISRLDFNNNVKRDIRKFAPEFFIEFGFNPVNIAGGAIFLGLKKAGYKFTRNEICQQLGIHKSTFYDSIKNIKKRKKN